MRATLAFRAGRPGSDTDRVGLESERQCPLGFERITVGRAEILARTEAVPWSRHAVMEYGTLYQAALHSADRTLHGRGPVPILPNPEGPGPPWAIRRYYRGGLMRPLGDRFLRAGRPRSFVEAEISAKIEELGFPTPRVVAAAVYPSGIVYRADMVTELVPHVGTLADVLFGEDDPSGTTKDGDKRREALASTSELIKRMSRSGIRHRDFNAENILIARDALGVHATLVDLDRCGVVGPRRPVDAGTLRRRLARSIRKLERTRARPRDEGEKPLTHDEMNRLLRGGEGS
jgi:hypothetical protein